MSLKAENKESPEEEKKMDRAKVSLTCRQMPTLTRQPKLVETARGARPSEANSLVKEVVNAMRGRSSDTTTQARTQAKFTPFA